VARDKVRYSPGVTKLGVFPLLLALACGPSTPAPMSPTAAMGGGADLADAGTGDAAPPGAVIDAAPPPPKGRIAVVSVLSAEILGRMPNGDEWDARDSKGAAVDGALALYLKRHPELVPTRELVGVPIDAEGLANEAATSPAADPMVLVQVGDRVYRSPVRPRAFNPVWDFSFQFALGTFGARQGVAEADRVRLQVVDYDGPTRFDTIGSTVTTVGELLAKPLHRLGPFGSVKSLTLEVATIDLDELPEPSVFRIAVPGNAVWTDTGLEVIAGQRIEIDAADEVCTSQDDLTQCSGPEGQPRFSEHHVAGFAELGHGALIGSVGDTRFAVRRRVSLLAPSSGRLRLGINDRKSANNRGSYAVRVAVSAVP
jgi:hypothetical protein